jgi:alpha-tubulin suppressor-like RCC1 family protein
MPPKKKGTSQPAQLVIPAGIEQGGKAYSEVFGWGRSAEGQVNPDPDPLLDALRSLGNPQLGLGKSAMDDEKKTTPTAVEDLNLLHVKMIAAGPEHTLVVSTNSEVFSCGASSFGKLGHRQAEMDEMDDAFHTGCCHSFREINVLKEDNRAMKEGDIRKMVCGAEYSLAIADNGSVYTWGEGTSSQLGHQENTNKKLPTKVSALLEKKVPAGNAACGFNHVILTTASAEYGEIGREFGMTISGGLAMAMGSNECGQLGIDDPQGRPQWTPQMLDKKLRSNIEGSVDAAAGSGMFGGCKVTQLAAGQWFSLAVAGGKVWSWGTGDSGQLGLTKPPDDPNRPKFIPMRFHVHAPQEIAELRSVRQITAGSTFSLALCDDGKVYSWGKNEIGQLGHGDKSEREKPTEVEALSGKGTKMVVAGDRHVLALVEGGKVFSWGSCRDGQLGLDEPGAKVTPQEVPGLENMEQIAAAGNVSWAWRTLQAKGPEKKKRKAEAAPEADAEPEKKKKKAPAKKKKK